MTLSTAPAGTISQTARGLASFSTNSAQRCGADGVFLEQRGNRICRAVEDDAFVAALQKAAHHVGSHPAEPDHS